MVDFSIRPATIEDAPGLRIIRSQAIEASYSGRFERNRFADLVVGRDGRLATFLDSDQITVLVAATDKTPVGYVVIDDEAGEILGLFTSPDFRQAGIGSSLLERATMRLAKGGHETVRATVPDVVRPFFSDHGFEVKEADEWRGLPATSMVASLDP